MQNQTIAYKLVLKYYNVISNFYKGVLIGCNKNTHPRLYLNLHSKEIFYNAETSQNTRLTREVNNLSEIAYNNGLGSNLSDDDFEYLIENGVSDFGFDDWIDGYLIPNIVNALNDWDNRGKEQA